MSHHTLRTSPDPAHAWQARQADTAESQRLALALRRQHEQATAQLRAGLPFAWLVGQVRPRAHPPAGPPDARPELLHDGGPQPVD